MLSHLTQLCWFPISFLFSSYFSSYFHCLPGALLPGAVTFPSSMLNAIKVPPGPPCQQLSRMIQHRHHPTPPAELWDVSELSEAPASTPSCAHSFPARLFSRFSPFASNWVQFSQCETLHFPPSPTARLQGPPQRASLPSGPLCIPSNQQLEYFTLKPSPTQIFISRCCISTHIQQKEDPSSSFESADPSTEVTPPARCPSQEG